MKTILAQIDSVLEELEENGLYVEADALHEILVKLYKKKKKKSGKNVPNDPALYSRCKSEIKKKFSTWPSAYGSSSLVRLYKSRGGTYRSE